MEAEVGAAEFLTLSERLTGASGLDQGVAQTFLGAFLATGQGPELRALVDNTGDPASPLTMLRGLGR